MANTKNEHVFLKKDRWIVVNENSNKISRLFKNKKDVMKYVTIIASSNSGSIVSHKNNKQLKDFKNKSKIHTKTTRIEPVITKTIDIINPIVKRRELITEIISSI